MQYYYGRGVAVDKEAAVRWFSEAAKNGHPRAAKMFEAARSAVPEEKPGELASTQAPAEPSGTPSAEAAAPEKKPLDTAAAEAQPSVSTALSVVTAEPAEATVALAPTEPPATPAPAADGDASEWIAAQPGENFTIQLFATQDKNSIDALIERTSFAKTFGWFQFEKDNQTWYALLQGSYGSSREAEASVQRLPKNIQRDSVWIRKFSDVHRVMNSD
jgi:DamX protein